jgi:hypothetical protein
MCVGQDSFELTDEVCGGDDLFAHPAQQLDGSGIDQRDVHDGVAWRVLHGDAGVAGQQRLDLGFEFLPGGVLGFGAGEGVEASGFDAMDEFFWLAGRRDEVVPAASDVGVFVEAEDAVGERVAMVVIVKQPAVEMLVAQRGLDGGEIHGGDFIWLEREMVWALFS